MKIWTVEGDHGEKSVPAAPSKASPRPVRRSCDASTVFGAIQYLGLLDPRHQDGQWMEWIMEERTISSASFE